MLISSFSFVIFLLVFALLYFILPKNKRWLMIIIGSLYFYASLKPEYPLIIALSIIINYFLALSIFKNHDSKSSKLLLIIGVSLNVAALVLFKYLNFLSGIIVDFLSLFSLSIPPLVVKILLPIGISFYTFQNISYLIDVYNKRYPPEKNILLFASYALFFPKFLSGPIERAGKFIPQIKEGSSFSSNDFLDGFFRIFLGLFKKLVIADRLAVIVAVIFGDVSSFSSSHLFLAVFLFGFQLYIDFSGYTDIAIGAAKVLGIRLTENFHRPFFSRSVSEFWRRWHISLSTWFQDYVFVPIYLKFSKSTSNIKNGSIVTFIISIVIVEVLLGLWHGANLTFFFFGLYYGVAISLYYVFRKKWDFMNRWLQITLTFILINIGWVFFRAKSMSDATYIFTHLFSNIEAIPWRSLGLGMSDLVIAFFGLIAVIIIEFFCELREINGKPFIINNKLKALLLFLLIILTIFLGLFSTSPFIYFQF